MKLYDHIPVTCPASRQIAERRNSAAVGEREEEADGDVHAKVSC